MRNPFSKKTGTDAIAAEIAVLRKRASDTEAKHAALLTSIEEATEQRREALSGEDDVDAITKRIRDLKTEAEDLAALLADINIAVGNAATRLADVKNQEARVQEADKLEKVAGAVDTRVADVAKAATAFAKAVRAMAGEIPDGMACFRHDGSRPRKRAEIGSYASGREAVAGVVAEALAAVLPEAFDLQDDKEGYRSALQRVVVNGEVIGWDSPNIPAPPIVTSEIVATLVTGPLRGRAAALRRGEFNGEEAKVSIRQEEPPAPRSEPDVLVVAAIDFKYVAGRSNLIGLRGPHINYVTAHSKVWLPAPVAKAARARGCAYGVDEPRGLQILDEIIEKEKREREKHVFSRRRQIPADAYQDLGDPAGFLSDAKPRAMTEVIETVQMVD